MGGAEDRLNGPCIWGTPAGRCGATPTHPYPCGAKCDPHSPWAHAGRPRPGHLKTDTEPQEGGTPA